MFESNNCECGLFWSRRLRSEERSACARGSHHGPITFQVEVAIYSFRVPLLVNQWAKKGAILLAMVTNSNGPGRWLWIMGWRLSMYAMEMIAWREVQDSSDKWWQAGEKHTSTLAGVLTGQSIQERELESLYQARSYDQQSACWAQRLCRMGSLNIVINSI